MHRGARVVTRKRDLYRSSRILQSKGTFLKDHARFIIDEMLGAKLVMPVGGALHVQGDADLVHC